MKRRGTLGGGFAVALALCASLCAFSAIAQTEIPKSIGIKMGEGRLHPFLDVDTEFDGKANPVDDPTGARGTVRPS